MLITSQNHGFAVDRRFAARQPAADHVSLFDGSLQGVARTDVPAFSFQGHPEAEPRPARRGLPVRPFPRCHGRGVDASCSRRLIRSENSKIAK